MTDEARPAPPDPWKGFRGVMAGTLILETIVVLLTLLVTSKFGSNGGPFGVAAVLVLAAAMIMACRYLKKPWAIQLVVGLQVLLLLSGFLVTALAVLGLLFGLVWFALLMMRRDVARKMAAGQLPSQQQPW